MCVDYFTSLSTWVDGLARYGHAPTLTAGQAPPWLLDGCGVGVVFLKPHSGEQREAEVWRTVSGDIRSQ